MARRLIVLLLAAGATRAQEQQEVRHARVSEFQQLPQTVRRDLEHRGCTVPQPPYSKRLENVIAGRFRNLRDQDWAILCSLKSTGRTLLLVYSPKPAVVDEYPAGSGCWDLISAVGRPYIMEHFRLYGGPKPPPISHQGINVGCEKASVVRYFYQGRWLTLAGAD